MLEKSEKKPLKSDYYTDKQFSKTLKLKGF